MDKLKAGAQAVGDKISALGAKAGFETNKAEAQDSENPAGKRVGAAVDAAGDKVKEWKHEASKEAHKQQATH